MLKSHYLVAGFATLITWSQSTSAQTPIQHAGFQAVKFHSTGAGLRTSEADFISVSPSVESKTKRQSRYQIMSTGQIGDFSTLNWKQTKSHTYFILPADHDILIDQNVSGKLKVTSASGLLLHFKNGSLDAITDSDSASPCEFSKNPSASLSERDFTIGACEDRVVFDAGIGSANGAYANLNGTTRVTDPAGSSCTIQNSKLFIQNARTKADAQMKSQAQVLAALKAEPACSKLELASLRTKTVSAKASTSASKPAANGTRPRLTLPYLESSGSSN